MLTHRLSERVAMSAVFCYLVDQNYCIFWLVFSADIQGRQY